MELKIQILSPNGDTIVDLESVKNEVSEELRAASEQGHIVFNEPVYLPPPKRAQGISQVVQWVLEVLGNNPGPALTLLVFAIKEIYSHFKSKTPESEQSAFTIVIVIGGNRLDFSDKEIGNINEAVIKDLLEQHSEQEND